ncbi:MAG: cryptochrome/photolyase family protein [Candidatus Puniceispirillales bacterium]
MTNPSILWFRVDLRLSDNPAFQKAIELGKPIIPIYILDDDDANNRKLGDASKWWLHNSLKSIYSELEKVGSKILFFKGNAEDVIKKIIEETNADTVLWNRRYEPWAVKRDKSIKENLILKSKNVFSFNGSLLYEPWEIKSKIGNPLKVFTPFKRALLNKGVIFNVSKSPNTILSPSLWPSSLDIDDLDLVKNKLWTDKFANSWVPGSKTAKAKLISFKENNIHDYNKDRDIPSVLGTSKLSPHLRFGEISPKEIFIAMNDLEENDGVLTYKSEIIWREFAHNLLWYFPDIHEKPIKNEFSKFMWDNSQSNFDLWTKGMTGYPIVDAGMRELWSTGWMHNRIRMVTASFLTKHLLLPWQMGEKWFWNTLLDADPASNTSGWQWVSGSGADAAPYFRIFNPIIQGQKFDPEGEYVKKFIPELKDLPSKFIHEPWKADSALLKKSDIKLGETYPLPIVDHKFARERALNKYAEIRN